MLSGNGRADATTSEVHLLLLLGLHGRFDGLHVVLLNAVPQRRADLTAAKEAALHDLYALRAWQSKASCSNGCLCEYDGN